MTWLGLSLAAAGAGESLSLNDIRDIKELESIALGFDWRHWAFWTLAALLLLALLGWITYRRRQGRKQPGAAVPALSPDDRALVELDELERAEASDPRMYYFRLSTTLRAYLGGRFQLAALEMTSDELILQVPRLGLGSTLELELKTFLRRSDPIKFAGCRADAAAMHGDLQLIRQVVLETSRMKDRGDHDR